MPGATATAEQLYLFDSGPDVAELRRRADLTVMSAKAPNTRRAYASDWKQFSQWCAATGRSAMPATADTLRLYISALMTTHAMSTINRRVAAIADKHKTAGAESPLTDAVRKLMRGARRTKGTAPTQKAALSPEDLRRICRKLAAERTPIAIRDRAILTLGFAAAMRRSEICALDLADVRFASKGIALTLRRSKTDQEGRGREVGIFHGHRPASCPVLALNAWIRIRGKQPGPLFTSTRRRAKDGGLSGRSIGELVKRCVRTIGLDAAAYGAHSLRAGCITAAILAGAQTPMIMKRSGHRSMATLEKYVRTATLFTVDVLARAM